MRCTRRGNREGRKACPVVTVQKSPDQAPEKDNPEVPSGVGANRTGKSIRVMRPGGRGKGGGQGLRSLQRGVFVKLLNRCNKEGDGTESD